MLIAFLILFTVYAALVLSFWIGWRKTPFFMPAGADTPITFSLIIPARNEEATIGKLLAAIADQDYPSDRFEVIVVDDHSTDSTAGIVKSFSNTRLLQLKDDEINSYKKKALEQGIHAAGNEWIVTTDADCIPQQSWLSTLASFIQQTNAVFVAAPVSMNADSSILQAFQAIDFMILQGITGASVEGKKLSMCNGANLAYRKEVFKEVNGFQGIDDIASGDDMLLMHKIWKRYPDRVRYLKSDRAIVSTEPMTTWRGFINQRIRWASKATRYDDKLILPILLLVYLFNLSFIVLAVAGFWHRDYWLWLAPGIVAKTIVELPFYITLSAFFRRNWPATLFLAFQPLHILYTVISGLFGQFGKYEWKGRRVK